MWVSGRSRGTGKGKGLEKDCCRAGSKIADRGTGHRILVEGRSNGR